MKVKKMIKISLSVIVILVMACTGCIVYKSVKIINVQRKTGDLLPDTFRIEVPVKMSENDRFLVEAVVNDSYRADFIIDTQASSLMKMEQINELNGHFYENMPIPTFNLYGQSMKTPLYYFDSFKIQSLVFNKPLFHGISKSNEIHGIMTNNIVGFEILKRLCWKFSLDDGKMILFSNKDAQLLLKEAKDYIKIENGIDKVLSGGSNVLLFPNTQTQGNFMADMGYNDEIMVNKKIFDSLSEKIPYRKFLSPLRTSAENMEGYVFEKMTVEWNGIKVPNCQVTYTPTADRNIIGTRLIKRFNFIMAYQEDSRDLYLQPRKDFQSFASAPYSAFGFNIKKQDGGFTVNLIEENGVAAKAGIRLKDTVVHIDNGAFNLNDTQQLNTYLSDKTSVTIGILKDGKTADVKLIL
jgi:hypothetical protein